MKRVLVVLGLQVLAFWDVWRWYVSRAVYSWDQPWGVLALVAAVVFLVVSRKPWPQEERSLLLPTLLMISTQRLFCRLAHSHAPQSRSLR
jgi:hypothetical protein